MIPRKVHIGIDLNTQIQLIDHFRYNRPRRYDCKRLGAVGAQVKWKQNIRGCGGAWTEELGAADVFHQWPLSLVNWVPFRVTRGTITAPTALIRLLASNNMVVGLGQDFRLTTPKSLLSKDRGTDATYSKIG